MNKLLIITIILFIFIKYSKSNLTSDNILNKFKYYDENGKKIDHLKNELDEQLDALEYIEPTDIVLELGGRYGTVSTVIAYKQNNNGNLIVIEPDKQIINSLENNKKINNANFTIINKYISNDDKKLILDGYGTKLVKETFSNEVSKITYNDFKKQYPLKFNVLIADCEGCLCDFIKIIGDDINNYNKILFEADQKELCNYEILLNDLKNKGFKIIKKNYNEIFRYVLLK